MKIYTKYFSVIFCLSSIFFIPVSVKAAICVGSGGNYEGGCVQQNNVYQEIQQQEEMKNQDTIDIYNLSQIIKKGNVESEVNSNCGEAPLASSFISTYRQYNTSTGFEVNVNKSEYQAFHSAKTIWEKCSNDTMASVIMARANMESGLKESQMQVNPEKGVTDDMTKQVQINNISTAPNYVSNDRNTQKAPIKREITQAAGMIGTSSSATVEMSTTSESKHVEPKVNTRVGEGVSTFLIRLFKAFFF